ncbi:MAG: exonuclease SbcCD subunit D [candidate division WOR-3 bacterium]
MRFVHVADTHIGAEASKERADDFRSAFREIIDRTLELSARAFVHAGDLFHSSRPSVKDIVFVASEIKRLINEGIEVLLLHGNHDRITIKGEVPPQSILELFGAKVFGFTSERRCYTIDGVEFWGIPYMHMEHKEHRDRFIEFLSEIGSQAKSPAVLVLHQFFYPPTSFGNPILYADDIPEVFSYAALGHWHLPWKREGFRYAYPGAPEPTELASDQAIEKRGFWLVDITEQGVKLEFQALSCTRPFLYLESKEDELIERLNNLKDKIKSSAKKPMLKIKLTVGPDTNADQLIEGAICTVGLKREEIILLSPDIDRAIPSPFVDEISEEYKAEDIIAKFFGDDPQQLELVLAMRDAIRQTEAERESSGTQATRDRQALIEAAKDAAQRFLKEKQNAPY